MKLRALFRGIYLIWCVISFLLVAFLLEIGMALLGMAYSTRQRMRCKHASFRIRRMLDLLGFRVQIEGLETLKNLKTNGLWVANHLSLWDPLIFTATIEPVVFITSVEVRDTPVVGWLARAVGSVFVERRNRNRIHQEVGEVSRELIEGRTVVLYPEATSTNGSQILPFKRAFFRSAVEASKPVVPLCINYKTIDGEPLNRENRDLIFYYGGQNLITQLYRILQLQSIEVEVRILEPLNPESLELGPEKEGPFAVETYLSNRSYELISQSYVPIL